MQQWHIRLAVQECINRYAMLFDAGRFDELSSLFAEDAVFDVSPSPSFMQVPLRGRPAIIDHLSRRHREVSDRGERHQHVCTNTVFDVLTEDRCVTRTYLTSVAGGPDMAPKIATFGTYHDVFRRMGEEWLIAERHLRTSTAIP